MPGVYDSGYHHFFTYDFKCSQFSHAFWEYRNGLDHVPSGEPVWLAAAGTRPGSSVTFHIRKPGSDVDLMAFTTRGHTSSNCVLYQEQSPPITLAPGWYEVFADLKDGNLPSGTGTPESIDNWRLTVKGLEVR
jgi:hypothetical protein